MIHVALASTYPTETDAREALTNMPDDTPYLGIWQLPELYGGIVHVFTDTNPQQLEAAGWTRPEERA